jgi:hypothetical protein
MKNAPRILSAAGLVIIILFFINSINHPDNNPSKNTSDLYEIKALKIPSNLSFCGEKVPLKKDDVKERIDRELLVNTYWQSNGLLFLKRSNKYFPVIEPILKKYNVPDDFKYLALIESGLQNITSPAGAKGFWQLMPKTAKEYNLEVNSNVDERYNLEKSTEAACKYLLEAYDKFGTWTLAAAAYNAGMSGINKQIERQMVGDYYDLLLGDETSRYVPRIVAVKEILNHPKKYGFIYDNDDLYRMMPTRTITVDTVITNLADFAKDYNINYKELKILNPWLRENKLNNKTRRLYYIKLPK